MSNSGTTAIVLRIVACGVLFDALIPLSPFVVESFGVGYGDFQRTLSAGFLLFSGIQFLAPRFAAGGKTERLLVISTLAVAGSSGMLALSSTFFEFSLVLLLMFSANALGAVSARALLRSLLDTQKFEKALASAYSTMSAGAVVAPIVVVVAATRLHWKLLMILPLTILCAVCLFLPRRPKDRSGGSLEAHASIHGVRAFTRLLRKKEFCMPLLMGLAVQGLFGSTLISKPSVLAGRFDMAPSMLGTMLGAMALIEVLAFYLSARATERFGWQRRMCAAWVCLAFGTVAILASAWFDSLPLFLAFATLVVVFFCIALPISATLALDVPAEERVHAAALYGGIQSLGGALIVFFLSAMPGSPVAALSLLSTLVLLVMPALQFALYRHGRGARGG